MPDFDMIADVQKPNFACFICHALLSVPKGAAYSLEKSWHQAALDFSLSASYAAILMSDKAVLSQLAHLRSSESLPAAITFAKTDLTAEQLLAAPEASRPLVLLVHAMLAVITPSQEVQQPQSQLINSDNRKQQLEHHTLHSVSNTNSSGSSIHSLQFRMSQMSLQGKRQLQTGPANSSPQTGPAKSSPCQPPNIDLDALLRCTILVLKLAEMTPDIPALAAAETVLWPMVTKLVAAVQRCTDEKLPCNARETTQPDTEPQHHHLTSVLVQLALRILKAPGSMQAAHVQKICYHMLSSLLESPHTRLATVAHIGTPGISV